MNGRAQCVVRAAMLAAGLVACRSHPATQVSPPSIVPARGEAAAAPSAPRPAQGASARPAPAVRVTGAPGPGGEVAISVQNRAPEPVALTAAVNVERRAEQGFAPVPGGPFTLAAGAGCVQLAPGAELRPTPWRAQAGAAQGTYRFVLEGCEGDYRIEGEPFDLK